jgi:hypothetical protein
MARTTPYQLKLVTIEWKPKYKVYQGRGEMAHGRSMSKARMQLYTIPPRTSASALGEFIVSKTNGKSL